MRRFTLALTVALAAPCPASASIVCEIKATKDGFVALRSGPGGTAPLTHRMKPGDEALVMPERRPTWIRVTYWRGGRFQSGRSPEGDPATAIGWMHGSLVGRDSCG